MMDDEGYDDFEDATAESTLLQQSPTAYAEDVMRRSVAGASAASADDIMIEGGEGSIGDSESSFFLTEAAFWINFLAIICNLVTLVNMLFEGQIVVQMCLEFIDEDDESYKYSDQAIQNSAAFTSSA